MSVTTSSHVDPYRVARVDRDRHAHDGARRGADTAHSLPHPRPRVRAHRPDRLDIVMVNLAFYLAWYARYRVGLFVALDPGNYVEHEVYLPLQIGLSLVFVFVIALRGLYRLPRAASAVDDLSTVVHRRGHLGDAAVRRLDLRALPGRVAPDADLRLGAHHAADVPRSGELAVDPGRAARARHRRRADAGRRRQHRRPHDHASAGRSARIWAMRSPAFWRPTATRTSVASDASARRTSSSA